MSIKTETNPVRVGESKHPSGSTIRHADYYTDREADTHVVYYAYTYRNGTPAWVYSATTNDRAETLLEWFRNSEDGVPLPMFLFAPIVWEAN